MDVDENRAPLPPFGVQVSIKGEDWEYVVRTIEELAVTLRDHMPVRPIIGGGAGGSHWLAVSARDVSPETYRRELSEWLHRALGRQMKHDPRAQA